MEGVPVRIGALKIFGRVQVRTPAACVTGEYVIHCARELGIGNCLMIPQIKSKF